MNDQPTTGVSVRALSRLAALGLFLAGAVAGVWMTGEAFRDDLAELREMRANPACATIIEDQQ